MPTPWSRYVLFTALLLLVPTSLPSTAASAAEPDDATTAGAGEAARAAYSTALRREHAGDAAGARRAYERVLALDPEHRAARRALGYEEVDGYWLRGDELRRAQGFVHHGGRWMTAVEFADATRPGRDTREQKMGEAKVWACLAAVASDDAARVRRGRRQLATLPAAHQLAPLARALRCEPSRLRVFAAESLARLGDPLAVPALLKRAVDDPEEQVRRAAADALRTIDAPGTLHPLARALWSSDSTVRVRAAEALGHIGDVAAAPYVVARWEKRSGAFARAYFTQIDQFSYIQDFDVEVASTSFIADPLVGVLQQGVVQDVRIHATEQITTKVEQVAYANALRRLSGLDHGHDVQAWRRWVDER